MKVGINLLLWTVHPNATEHAPLLESIKAWGFDGVEFPLAGMATSDARDLGVRCEELRLERTAIFSLTGCEADPASPDPAQRQAAVERIKHAVDLAHMLGSELLAGPLFQRLEQFTGMPPTLDEWRWSLDAIRQSARYAAQGGIRLALEVLNRFEMYLVNTIADGARFCRETGLSNVGLLADTHHSNIEEPRPAKAWADHLDTIFHVHISENDRGIPGRGHAATPEIFAALRRGGYDGWCMIEAFSPKVEALRTRLHVWRPFFESEEQAARLGLEFVRSAWAAAGQAAAAPPTGGPANEGRG
jgi:D-psicose/D-tagatose/L-ribulose 3-epimerase